MLRVALQRPSVVKRDHRYSVANYCATLRSDGVPAKGMVVPLQKRIALVQLTQYAKINTSSKPSHQCTPSSITLVYRLLRGVTCTRGQSRVSVVTRARG